ncbi:hypothetical protein F5Y05DRAFT_284939 [Hypoxylon sp. FL0543]|nr:hypothetical protein F5Y05DRAFT_284939 [Hypoxylon sp. FL0543]
MGPFQVSLPLGNEPLPRASDGDQNLPNAKQPLRFVKQPQLAHPFAYSYDLSIASSEASSAAAILDTQSNGTSSSQGVDSRSPCQSLTQHARSSEALFHLFPKLAPELRLKIWRETWEHRNVALIRQPLDNPDSNTQVIELLRLKHITITGYNWGVRYPNLISIMHNKYSKEDLMTITNSMVKSPSSLWVNRESRAETLRHFKLALGTPDGCPNIKAMGNPLSNVVGGLTNTYFNFNLDILVFTLHSPLSAAFSKADLSQLRRVSIPERAPVLPDFIKSPREALFIPELEIELENEQHETTYEFRRVWRILRKFFPALREIRLEPFYSCQRYHSPKVHSSSRLPDYHCTSCSFIQKSLDRWFPRLHTDRFSTSYPQQDLDRMLDHHNIMRPLFKEEKLVIGTVPGEGRGKGEDVTVTFRAIYDGEENPNILDLNQQRIDWDLVKRSCVIANLEHALGPPNTSIYSYMVYKI